MSNPAAKDCRNGIVRLGLSCFLTLAAFELSRWAAVVLKPDSPERIYAKGSLAERRETFESLFEARFATTPKPIYYTLAGTAFTSILLATGMCLTALALIHT